MPTGKKKDIEPLEPRSIHVEHFPAYGLRFKDEAYRHVTLYARSEKELKTHLEGWRFYQRRDLHRDYEVVFDNEPMDVLE
jgi:hypothetical protein